MPPRRVRDDPVTASSAHGAPRAPAHRRAPSAPTPPNRPMIDSVAMPARLRSVVHAPGPRVPGTPPRPTVMARVVLQFAIPGLLVLLLVGLGAVLVFRARSEKEAIRDARQLTGAIGQGMIEPRLDGRIVAGDRQAIATLDRYVREKVLPLQPSLVRMKLWTGTGRLVYSDERRLIGTHATLDPEELAALDRDAVVAEGGKGRLLEVYLPLHNVNGVPLLFETYLRYSSVSANARAIWLTFAPALVAALLLLWIVQLPLAWSFGGRLRRHEQEREALLLGAMHASEDERRRIAGDLHDGVVQDLTGVSMTLGAAMAGARGTPMEPLIAQAAESTRHSIREMRSLMVDIAPANLQEEGLEGALEDLLARLTARGVRTEARIDGPLGGDQATDELMFRTARETLRAAQRRTGLTSLVLDARMRDRALVLEVTHDGAPGGAPDGAVDPLEALGARATALGGRLAVAETPAGRAVTLTLPA
jgi:two-component system, NarL family, sensor kinase